MQKLRSIKEYSKPKTLKRKKVCKFTKGEHKFILVSELESKFFRPHYIYKEFKCELCGKKDLKIEKMGILG